MSGQALHCPDKNIAHCRALKRNRRDGRAGCARTQPAQTGQQIAADLSRVYRSMHRLQMVKHSTNVGTTNIGTIAMVSRVIA
jgi:Leu/Phe-tRNA-protein transferase